MKQTAIEWLMEQLKTNHGFQSNLYEEFEQAKAMEKEQIIEAYKADMHPCSDEDAEQYYNKTFNK